MDRSLVLYASQLVDVTRHPGQKLPKQIAQTIKLTLPPDARKAYSELYSRFATELKSGEVTAVNAGARTVKLRQCANGALYLDGYGLKESVPNRQTRRWGLVHDEKLDALEELIDELNGQSALAAYEFEHDLARLTKRFPQAHVLAGGAKQGERMIKAWNDGEVTLQLKLDISAVGAPGYQGLPTFNSRTVNSTIRLRDGETNLLAGLILDNERRGLTGIPGLANVPFLGRLFARNRDEAQQTDIVMTLTPHIIRRSDIDERDLRSFLVGGEASPFLFEVPAQQPAAPPQQGRPEPTRIEPIRPPAGQTPPD